MIRLAATVASTLWGAYNRIGHPRTRNSGDAKPEPGLVRIAPWIGSVGLSPWRDTAGLVSAVARGFRGWSPTVGGGRYVGGTGDMGRLGQREIDTSRGWFRGGAFAGRG